MSCSCPADHNPFASRPWRRTTKGWWHQARCPLYVASGSVSQRLTVVGLLVACGTSSNVCGPPRVDGPGGTTTSETCHPLEQVEWPDEVCEVTVFCCDEVTCWLEQDGEPMDPFGDGEVCRLCSFGDDYEAEVRPLICGEG